MPYAIYSPEILPINIEESDSIYLFYNNEQIFAGKVIDADLHGKEQEFTLKAYDYCWWVCKSNITKNFSNISVIDAVKWVYENIGIIFSDVDEENMRNELGVYADLMLDTHLIEDKPANKVLYAIYSDVHKKTGLYYYMHTNGDGKKVVITEADRYYSGLTIEMSDCDVANGNLINLTTHASMENMVTQIRVYGEDGKPANIYSSGDDDSDSNNSDDNRIAKENGDIYRYGVIQEIIKMTDDDSVSGIRDKAAKRLEDKGVEKTLEITCFGDLEYKPAYGVLVKIPCTSYYDKFMYINESNWVWNKDGTFISQLTLQESKHHDLTEWEEIETKDSDDSKNKSGTTSELVDNIIAELKSHLGLKYVFGGDSPETGMDCSHYIAYCYNKFADKLEITSSDGTLHPPTYTMMNEGKDVTSDFKENLRKCDIIFPHSGHVVAYIGDGQVIHEPKTGDVCKISDIWFSKPTKVIRVVPDSAWTTESSDGGNASTDGSLDSAVNCTKQKEFGDMVYKYAKELFKTYHIFPGVIISCMIQESWTGSGFTKLAKNYFNFGGVKCSASSQDAVQDYKPPASEGSMLYRKFNSLKDFMIYWCKLISGQTGMSVYKTNIADKNTPKEQIMGFNNTPYAGDKTKSKQMLAIYNQNNFSNYDEGL
jgi:flagellum-specific peptidoglycan hydrolase FlgJ